MIKKEIKANKRGKNKKNLFTTRDVAIISILTLVVSFTMGIAISYSSSNIKGNYSKDIVNFLDEYKKIKDSYYEDIDDKEAMKTALDSIIESLDDYSVVVDDSLSNTLTTKLQGEYQGFGIEVANDKDMNIVIVSVIEDTPASEANLQPLDIIKKIDGKEVKGMTTTEFVNMVKESTNSNFIFELDRNGKTVTQEITRKLVTLNSVASEIYERNNKKIGYIYVSLFAYNTDVQFIEALSELEDKGIDSLIVDLRYNTGGHLTAVENMMSAFLDKTHIIYQIQTKESTTKHYSTGNITKTYPVVVLVNESSASASELFTATLKEEYGATIVGVTTYGKGTVQEVKSGNNVTDDYKLTTSKWLTPKGNWIHKTGIEPDIKVELDVKDQLIFTDEEDNQLQTAIDVLAK